MQETNNQEVIAFEEFDVPQNIDHTKLDKYDIAIMIPTLMDSIAVINAFGDELSLVISETDRNRIQETLTIAAQIFEKIEEDNDISMEESNKQSITALAAHLYQNAELLANVMSDTQQEQSEEIGSAAQEPHLNSVVLTDSNIGVLQKIVADEIRFFQQELKAVKKVARNYYDQCDPNNSETLPAFRSLNNMRNYIKKVNRRLRRLEDIQRNLRVNRTSW